MKSNSSFGWQICLVLFCFWEGWGEGGEGQWAMGNISCRRYNESDSQVTESKRKKAVK